MYRWCSLTTHSKAANNSVSYRSKVNRKTYQLVAATIVTCCEEENIKFQVITMTNRVYGGAWYGYLTTPKIQNLLAVCDDTKNLT